MAVREIYRKINKNNDIELLEIPISSVYGLNNTLEELESSIGVFIGSQEEYEVAYSAGKIRTGTIVVILDEGSSTTAVLGKAILGKMILGTK